LAGLPGSQTICSLLTKDYFSSYRTSRVRGGKGHELVASVVGMPSGDPGQSSDGVGIDADQASGGSDAAALVEVLEHGESLLLGEMGLDGASPLRSEERDFHVLQESSRIRPCFAQAERLPA
jgi:hypothetical protein